MLVIDPTFEVLGQTVSWVRIGGAITVVLVAVVLAAVLRSSIMRYAARSRNVNQATWYTVSRIVMYTVVVLGVFVSIGVLGLPISRLAFLGGAIGVGLGFGLQTIFSNFISGLILLFDKSLKVGDFVELANGITGEVRDIKIRATRIVTNDNIDIIVPNSEFVSADVTNWTYRESGRRMRIPFGVAYGVDKEVVKTAALEAAAEVPFTLALEGPRRAQVWLVEFGDSALNFELVVWLTQEATFKPAAVQAAYNWALHSALQRHDLEIPFPQRDINLRGFYGLQDDDALRALQIDKPDTDTVPPAPRSASTNDAIDDVTVDLPAEDAPTARDL